MKILLVNHFPLVGSGSGVYVTNIAQNLIKKGHEVCIIIPENTTKIKEIQNVKIHPVFFKREEEIEGQLDFNFACFDSHPRSNVLFSDITDEQIVQYEKAFRNVIEQEIKEFKPDIIHAQHIWIASTVATEYNIPVVITCHGSDLMGYNESTRYHHYVKKAMDNCKKVIAISKHNAEVLKSIFENDINKIITISNGYNPEVFYREKCKKKEVLKSYNIDGNYDKIICFAGRLNKIKGIDILLNSAKVYERQNILTLIAGHGSEYEVLCSLKEELGLKNVVFLGDKSHEDLRRIYSISDVCVIPSREEAFGLVALEAIACGTPVISTKQGGMPDFVNDKVGMLIEKENVEQLTEAINKVLNGEKKFDIEYLQDYAKKNYSQEILMKKLLAIYEEIKN